MTERVLCFTMFTDYIPCRTVVGERRWTGWNKSYSFWSHWSPTCSRHFQGVAPDWFSYRCLFSLDFRLL